MEKLTKEQVRKQIREWLHSGADVTEVPRQKPQIPKVIEFLGKKGINIGEMLEGEELPQMPELPTIEEPKQKKKLYPYVG